MYVPDQSIEPRLNSNFYQVFQTLQEAGVRPGQIIRGKNASKFLLVKATAAILTGSLVIMNVIDGSWDATSAAILAVPLGTPMGIACVDLKPGEYGHVQICGYFDKVRAATGAAINTPAGVSGTSVGTITTTTPVTTIQGLVLIQIGQASPLYTRAYSALPLRA